MISFWLGLLIGCALASFLWWRGFILAYRRVIRKKMAEIEYMKQAHRSVIADLISRMNHEGLIPHGVSADGLLGLISLVISNCINGLQRLLERRDWDTSAVITDLQQIAMVELQLLHKKLGEFIESKRSILRDYDKHQGL